MEVSTLDWLINVGVAGVVLICLMTGALVPGHVYKDLKRQFELRGQALELERQRNALLQQIAPVATRAMAVVAEVAEENRARARDTPPGGMSALEGGPR